MHIGYALTSPVAPSKSGAEERSDDALIVAIAKGDKLAMKVLFARHNVRVYRFALRLTRDELIKSLDGHAKGATGIVGTFSKP